MRFKIYWSLKPEVRYFKWILIIIDFIVQTMTFELF